MTHKNSVKWTTVYKKFVNTYNTTPHEGLLGITPDDADLPEYIPGVTLLNLGKMKKTAKFERVQILDG